MNTKNLFVIDFSTSSIVDECSLFLNREYFSIRRSVFFTIIDNYLRSCLELITTL